MKRFLLLSATIVINVIASAQTKSIVYFDSNKNDLSAAAVKSLDSVVNFLQDKNGCQIAISGYCDNTGIDRFNQILSDFRAESVFNYFREKKLDANFSFKGYAATNPIADNALESGKSKNRRVEILITLKKVEAVIVEKKVEPIVAESIPNTKPSALEANSKSEDLEVGKILILKNLNFEGGTSTLLKESAPSLKLLLKLLEDNPTMEVEIEGHVCCANDMALSVDRALTVLEYLVNNGINEKRLKYAGHSWNNPIASDATEEGRKSNRRVEIKILKK